MFGGTVREMNEKHDMPKSDIFHDTVKSALMKEGWQIMHDPYVLAIGKKRLFVEVIKQWIPA